ncbi:PGAP2-interacting protein [Holothuria leucospilota]|uniref:PGAP2-interacting protein n=1 Tax=Holothuria leucospilota TaxID=206669 RepID=A0A9Q1BJX6_HOLLE|nr:PGAP2-interacting protein [Holothuria leucospilota]
MEETKGGNESHGERDSPNVRSVPRRHLPVGRTFLRELLSETIIGMIFWSVFQELIPAVSLNILKELKAEYFSICAVWLSPALMTIPAIAKQLQSSIGLLFLRVVMVCSLASFQASSPDMRLALLAAGNFAAILLLGNTWWHKSCHQRSVSFWGILLGYVSILALKAWFISINPVWASPRNNSVFIALGILAALDRFRAVEYPQPEFKPHQPFSDNWALMAGGFGSLMFLTTWLFGDTAVLCRWSVVGYPYPGPHPFPAGVAVFIELMSGILLSTNQKLLTNFLWVWFVGGHMTVGVYYLSGFLSFACGLILGPFIMSAWTELADRVTSCPPVPTLMLTMAVYAAEVYCSIATVTPGLPYGFLFTGRAVLLITPVILLIGRSLLKGDPRDPQAPGNTHTAFSNLDGTGCFQMFADAKIYVIFIIFLGAGGYGKQYLHLKMPVVRPAQNNPPPFTGLVWNSQFMLDNNGMQSHERIANLLQQTDADIIAMVQSDSSRLFLGNRDTSFWLGSKLGMFDDFGPSSKLLTTGVSLLSKFPIIKSEHHVINSTEGPWVPALTATLNVSGNLLDVFAAHFPKLRIGMDRKYQTEFVTNFTRRSPNPVLFLASLSSDPGSSDYKRLKTFGKLKDIDPLDEDRFSMCIMYKNLIRLGFARISQSDLSEDELQMGKFQFTSVKSFTDNEGMTTDASNVEKEILFPVSFGNFLEGSYRGQGHHYQMGTPRYFVAGG